MNWDSGWEFHPDENNLWGASRSIKWFSNLDPKFYAYGGFPIYVYSLLASKVEARAVSAAAQTLIVILLFVIGKKLAGLSGGFLAAAMGVFSAGLMQAGHFLTVESLLGLFGLLLIFELCEVCETSKWKFRKLHIMAAAIVLGLGVGTKVSFAVFVLPFFSLLRPGLASKAGPFQIIKALATPVLSLLVAVSVFLLTNPFILTKWVDVMTTVEYETKVAAGSLSVFYTRQFIGTAPGWFQAIHVFPYVTGWLFLPMFLIGAFVVCFKYFKDTPCGTARSILIGSIVAAVLSFVPFWAKWTRYVVQVLPVLILIAGVGSAWIWEKGKLGKILAVMAVVSFLPQFFFAMNVYSNEDTRVAAAKWAEVSIPKDAKIFTEAMDLGILPFNPSFGKNIKLFNFYELDEVRAEEKQAKLDSLLDESDYFIILSRRIYINSLDYPDKFPRSAKFYRSLFDGSLGYKKIYESLPGVIPALSRNLSRIKSGTSYRFQVKPGITAEFFPEETFEVFDNPRVLIFKNFHERPSLDQNL
ncbi:hypothetical protein HYU89_02405 [Candidatus Collierbacteria bacterium]|nr:hypothetical protein [Candidatus Collierbacteria bacterium]